MIWLRLGLSAVVIFGFPVLIICGWQAFTIGEGWRVALFVVAVSILVAGLAERATRRFAWWLDGGWKTKESSSESNPEDWRNVSDRLSATLQRLIQEKEHLAYAKGRRDALISLRDHIEGRIQTIDDQTVDPSFSYSQLNYSQAAQATPVSLTHHLEGLMHSPCPNSYKDDWTDAMSAFQQRFEEKLEGEQDISAAETYLILQDLFYGEEGREGWYDALNAIGDRIDALVLSERDRF